jgi:hypothetical protein
MAKRPPSNVVSSARVDALADEPPWRSMRAALAALLAGAAGLAALTAALGWPEGGCTHQPPPGAAPLSGMSNGARHYGSWGTRIGSRRIQRRDGTGAG